MISRNVRRVAAGLMTAASLAFAQTVHTQRTIDPVATGKSNVTAQPADSQSIVPFKIHIPNDVIADLKQRLSRARFADELPGVAWDYGTNLGYLRTLVEYWRDKYNWRHQEKRLNEFDQFKTNIDGVDVHFIHQRSKNP